MSELIVPYDAGWPGRFEKEAERIREAIGPIAIEIEHIGSTAVPGMAGKLTIDIAVGVSQLNEMDEEVIAAVQELGYVYRGEAGVPGRHYFRKGQVYPRDFHVSFIEWQGPLWNDYLLLRGYLRKHPEEAALYVEAKRAAASAIEKPDPISYWEHKHAFVEEMLARARTST